METHDGNKMGRWGATSYLISNMLGSGIFITPVDILNYTNSVGLSLVVWVLSAVISALGAYTYIELGTSIRRSGSDFAYMCYVKWHAIGFMFMASACLFTFPLTLAIQAEAFSAYIIQGLNLSLYSCECSLADIGVSGGIFGHCWRTVVASKLIGFGLYITGLLLFLNFFSLKTFVARFQILATVAKLFSATIVILIGFYHFFIKGKTENLQNPFVGSDYKIGSLAGALFSGLFSYDGWDILNFGVEDIAVPQRTMPFAIVFGVSIVALLYVAMNFSYFVVLTVSEFRHSSAIATTFAQETMGSLHYLMSFLISILLLGSLNSTLFAASRCMFAASREGHLPAFLACKNERHDSPRAALFFHVILAITFSFTGNINQLVSYVSFGLWMQRCFTLSALLYIRLKHVPVHPEAIRVPIILSMTFLAISLSLVIVTISENFDTSAIGLSLLVIFAIIYGLLLCEWAPLRNIEWFHNVIDRINYWLCIQAQILFNGLVELGKTEEEQRVVRVSATRRDDEILPLRASSDEKTNDLGTVPSQIARPVLTNNSNPKKVINNKQDSNVIAIATEDETDDSAPSLATPSAASALTDTTKNRLSDNQQQQHRYSTYQPSYRSTVAEYYGSSYWENQNHPIYCSWNRTQHSPLNSAQNKVGALTSNTLPANYTSNSNSHITFRKEQTSVGSRAGGASLAATTLDTQSNCSLDTTTLSQHTNHLSSSLILTPANPVYLPTSAHISTRAQAAADNNTFLMSISPQGGVGSSGIAQGQLNANSAMIASAVSTTPSTVMQQFCCECAATQNRCSTDYCVCYASRRMCDEHCESARYRGDCLNQAICKCSCEVDSAKPAKNVCTKSERCDCLRMKEGCSKLCACKQVCKNREPPKRVQKVAKPTQGCQCAKAKKQCVKKECQCRSVYEFCSSSCKCAGDCSNGASKFHVPRHVQNCFLEHKAESSGLIVTLIGNDYIYRGDFYHESKSDQHVEEQLVAAIYDLISKYKVDLYDIVIFVSKSPCFHQDCEPKCEVVDECRSNRACAKLLGLLLSKIRKELSKVDVRMTAKFLYTHLNRGDLYTKQGILSMLQAGIKVEPLLMKDWSAIMDWSPHADHKGEYLQMWSNHNLDRSVAQSQSFINECRRALGLSMKFWVAEIHEIVTNTILYYSEIRLKCNELNDALKQLDLTATPHKIRSTPSKRRSFIDIIELRDKLLMRGTSESRSKTAGSNISVASDDAHAQAMVASFCGRSFDDNETNEIAQRIRRATTNINVEIETLLEFLTHKSATS